MAAGTKALIKSSFQKLLEEKEFSKITVKEIVNDCKINRNSFYYHYPDIPTLLEEIVITDLDELIAMYPGKKASLKEMLESLYSYLSNHKKKIYHLYTSYPTRVYEVKIMKACDRLVSAFFAVYFKDKDIDAGTKENLRMTLRCMLFGHCVDYILNLNFKDKYNCDSLAKMIMAICDEMTKVSGN